MIAIISLLLLIIGTSTFTYNLSPNKRRRDNRYLSPHVDTLLAWSVHLFPLFSSHKKSLYRGVTRIVSTRGEEYLHPCISDLLLSSSFSLLSLWTSLEPLHSIPSSFSSLSGKQHSHYLLSPMKSAQIHSHIRKLSQYFSFSLVPPLLLPSFSSSSHSFLSLFTFNHICFPFKPPFTFPLPSYPPPHSIIILHTEWMLSPRSHLGLLI